MDASLRDRFFTPGVARTITAPSTILLGAAAASVVVASGAPLIVAPIAGIVAAAARIAAAIPRRRRAEARIDPFAVPEPWRAAVVDALRAQVGYQQAVEGAGSGAVRSRLEEIGRRIDDGISEVWAIARHGAQLVRAHDAIDQRSATRDLDALEGRTDPVSQRTATALQAQLDTAGRLHGVIEQTRAQLRLLDARLDEAVARAVELSVQVHSIDDLAPVGDDVDGVVSEMEALRQAIEETSQMTGRAQTA